MRGMSAVEQQSPPPVAVEPLVKRVIEAAVMLGLLTIMLIWSGILPILGIIYLWQRFSL
jgi:hypothetical protein